MRPRHVISLDPGATPGRHGRGPEKNLKRQHNSQGHAENIDPEEESALMSRIATGDRAAYTEMADRYMTSIFRFAYSMTGDVASAEDITQEACLRLWRNAGQWKPSGRVRSWLLRIAHNVCMDEMRAAKPGMPLEDFETTLASSEPDARMQTQDSQVSDIVKTALFKLPERQRTALMLVHYSGCSNIEAAGIMELSVDAVESLLARGKQGLKGLLGGMKDNLLEG
jgi:RNA polymerase sigma-70 factor (ECF subfamily)